MPHFGEGGSPYYSFKNKLFFFFSFEGLRERTNNTYNQWIETEQYRNLINTQRPNSVTATGGAFTLTVTGSNFGSTSVV